jgi:Xaa-Pro aminopeptidase
MSLPAAITRPDELAPFRRAQQLALATTIEIAHDLREGTTEREAAARLERALVARGVTRWFHAPFAWFGPRSRFDGFTRVRRNFFPTDARLERGAVGILDVAPVIDGCPGDVAYAFQAPGADRAQTAAFANAQAALREVHALIPARVARGETMAQIAAAIDRAFAARGLDSRYRLYPFGVLGHHITRFAPSPDPRIGGFGVRALAQLVGGGVAMRVPGLRARSSLWSPDAERRVPPGLWSLEPHLGADGFGAKFEEMLVVMPDGDACWLDDALWR